MIKIYNNDVKILPTSRSPTLSSSVGSLLPPMRRRLVRGRRGEFHHLLRRQLPGAPEAHREVSREALQLAVLADPGFLALEVPAIKKTTGDSKKTGGNS